MPTGIGQMIAQEAELKRLELSLGLISKDDVIAWADEIIAETKNPLFQFYDISLAANRSTKDVELLLRDLREGADIAEVSEAAFRRFAISRLRELEAGNASPDKVAQDLYEVAWTMDLILPIEYTEFCNWIDDEFSLVRQGYKERHKAEMALRDFLRRLTNDPKA
jgi:hypothetical protein